MKVPSPPLLQLPKGQVFALSLTYRMRSTTSEPLPTCNKIKERFCPPQCFRLVVKDFVDGERPIVCGWVSPDEVLDADLRNVLGLEARTTQSPVAERGSD
jgi:hypothetical protein